MFIDDKEFQLIWWVWGKWRLVSAQQATQTHILCISSVSPAILGPPSPLPMYHLLRHHTSSSLLQILSHGCFPLLPSLLLRIVHRSELYDQIWQKNTFSKLWEFILQKRWRTFVVEHSYPSCTDRAINEVGSWVGGEGGCSKWAVSSHFLLAWILPLKAI